MYTRIYIYIYMNHRLARCGSPSPRVHKGASMKTGLRVECVIGDM